jgi:glycerophosphoryl diester phosphodiesterase
MLPLARLVSHARQLAAVHLERTQATDAVVRALVRTGTRVGVWTVNDKSEAARMKARGVHWIITDDPRAV